jgi:hypothetical protein
MAENCDYIGDSLGMLCALENPRIPFSGLCSKQFHILLKHFSRVMDCVAFHWGEYDVSH